MQDTSLQSIYSDIQYDEFVRFVKEHKLDCDASLINELVIPSKLKSIWSFIKDLKEKVSVKLVDLIKLFLDKVVFKYLRIKVFKILIRVF